MQSLDWLVGCLVGWMDGAFEDLDLESKSTQGCPPPYLAKSHPRFSATARARTKQFQQRQ